MQPDWDYVKKTTLWQYEDLIKKLSIVMAYPTIWKAYNTDLAQAGEYARRMFPDKNIEAGEYPANVLSTIERLQTAQICNWGNLFLIIPTRAECAKFASEHNLQFEEFIDLLNYLLRWALPFQTSSRELIDHESSQEMSWYGLLKQHKLSSSFDLLERGHTSAGRNDLAKFTYLPSDIITRLVHRADIARLPFVRRKTILPVCGAGYDTLAKIAAADLDQMESDLVSYFRHMGKSWENYKSVIVLKMMVTAAQTLPVIMKE